MDSIIFIPFWVIAFIGLILQAIPHIRLNIKNQKLKKWIESYERAVDKGNYFEELDFPIKLLDYSFTSEKIYLSLKECLKDQMKFLHLHLSYQAAPNSVAIFGLFVGTELFIGRHENYTKVVYYPLQLIIKPEGDQLRLLSQFPLDKTHDMLYKDLIYHIEICLLKGNIGVYKHPRI